MPTVGIKKLVLNKHFRQDYSQEECEKIFFDYGLELDEVTSEKESVEKERGAVANLAELSDQEVYKIEVPANRYDLLSVEGLTRALRIFRNEISAPRYEISTPKELQKIIVRQETSLVRPFVVGAVLRGITFDADSYASFIDLQDKLHQNICRKRSLVAIGTHDLDTIKGPFEYRAEKPSAIRFKPLNQTREFTAEELMTLYSTDSHLKAYLPIIADKELYPVIYDSNNVVCSMPPIINGDHSKITLKTKNVFIEATATDHTKAVVVLDTIVALFSEYCDQKYTVEPVLVEYYDDRRWQYPKLEYRTKKVRVKEINTKIGFELPAKEIATLLDRMSLEAKVIDDETLTVVVPPTRHDILHECDIAEDVGVAHGFNNLKQKLPEAHTVAKAFPLNELSEQLRFGMAAAGWTETLNFALCARDDIASKLRHPEALAQAVHIGNPKTQEFQVARTSLIPGLLKTISSNSHLPLPLKLFELQDVVLKNPDSDVGASNQRRLAALFYNKTAGFEIVHGLLDRIMRLLDVNPSSKTNENGYKIQAADDSMFFPDRCAKVLGPGDQVVGTLGVLHPEVILAFGLTLPCAALEINVEPF